MTVLTIPVDYDGQIYQSDGTYTKDDTGYVMSVGGQYFEIVPGYGYWMRYRSYLRFSLADLPAGLSLSQITGVRLYVYCYLAGQPAYHLTDVHAYNTNGQTDPSADTDATLYNRCASGNLYVDDSTALRTVGDKWFVLGGNVKQDILDAKAAVNRIALALHEEEDNEQMAELHTLEFPDSHKALLEITYELVIAKKPLMDGFVFVE